MKQCSRNITGGGKRLLVAKISKVLKQFSLKYHHTFIFHVAVTTEIKAVSPFYKIGSSKIIAKLQNLVLISPSIHRS